RRDTAHDAATRLGSAVPLSAVLLDGTDTSHVLEQLQRRVDRTRAGGIDATEPLLECLAQLVAVGRLVFELLEDDVLQIAALEHLVPKLVEPEFKTAPHNGLCLLENTITIYRDTTAGRPELSREVPGHRGNRRIA